MNEFYGIGDQEILDHCADDAVVSFLEGADPDFSDYPIKVDVYRPMEVGKMEDKTRIAKELLENLLERLDETYGNPYDGEYSKPTDNMQKASENLVEVVMKEYKPWACQKTGEVVEYSKEESEKLFS